MTTTDVIIVGGGIVGAAIARELSSDGRRVLVLERSFVGAGATGAGMGHIVVMDDSPAQLALTVGSRDLLDELERELPDACERDLSGTLWIAEDDAQLAEVRLKQQRHEAAGVRCEILDAYALATAEPNLRKGLAGALRVAGDAVVYPPAVARWLMDRAVDAGTELRCGVDVHSIGGGVVVTNRGTFGAPDIINATGAHAQGLSHGADIVPRKGHLLITDRYPAFCRHQLVELGYLASAHTLNSESVAFNIQPRRTGQLLIGSSREVVGWDASVNRRIVQRMLQRAVEFMPRLKSLDIIRTWTGFRPATAHKLPYISRIPAQPGVWIAAGHEGLGITTALGSARLLADLLLSREPWTDPEPYAL
ncbi:MAG: FAD-dependent oxidoreductase [Longimicrobiales bacterium]